MKKSLEDITVRDISEHAVWKFTNSSHDDLEVESVAKTTFENLDGLIIGTKVTFSDDSVHWALIQNISLTEQLLNDHFVTTTIARGDEWFPLARYHDVTFETYGPVQLASFMGKSVAEIFPISYDLREVLHSDSPRLVGSIADTPAVRLTEDELISLALQ